MVFIKKITCFRIRSIFVFYSSVLVIISLFRGIFIFFIYFNKQLNNQKVSKNKKKLIPSERIFKFFSVYA
jgi:hypothetical protein